MALTSDQQALVDVQIAIEADRFTKTEAIENKRAKLEAIRMARETLTENNRSKPADSREVTAADITTFAQSIEQYVNQ